jgi:Dual-action HEIGH metallo-peptidase
MTITKEIVLTVGLNALAFGCNAQSSETEETIDNLVQAGFPAEDITVVDGVVYVGSDAVVSLQASREMLRTDPSSTYEQYRTTNLVSRSLPAICVDGTALTGPLSDGLNRALANYNALGLTFRMTRTTGGTAGCNAGITARLGTGTGASAGFPSGGLPFNSITLGSGLQQVPILTAGGIIMHVLGHAIGLRHSDFFDRSISCGGAPTNEGDAGVGAILIQGTPSGASPGASVMNTCLNSNETGQFRQFDVVALQALY